MLSRPRACLVGGNANNGANDGFVYVNSNNELGIANQNYGSRNCEKNYTAVRHRHMAEHEKTGAALVAEAKKTLWKQSMLNAECGIRNAE